MTVFEVDDASVAKAVTLVTSPDFPKPVPEKSLKHDDLYSPIRPMKIATPVRVKKNGEASTVATSEEFGYQNHYGVEEMYASRPAKIGGYEDNTADTYFRRAEPVARIDRSDGLSHTAENRHRAMLGHDPRGEGYRAAQTVTPSEPSAYRGALDRQAHEMRDHVLVVEEEIFRTKQLLGILPQQENAHERHNLATLNPAFMDIQASMDRIDAEIADFGDASVADEDEDLKSDRKSRLKEEVQALRMQVLQAKAARLERATSASSFEEVSEDNLVPEPYRFELWGNRRSSENHADDPRFKADIDPEAQRSRGGQQCLTGEKILCTGSRQCV
jgi:hypothetical protein